MGEPGPDYLRRLPLLAHELAALYLIGSFAYLQGRAGPRPWKGTGVDEDRFEQFACIRNALTDNKGDISQDHDDSCLGRLRDIAAIPGVSVNGTVVSLDLDFTEQVRQSFPRLSKHLRHW